jgi:hypothetical protein
MPLAVNAGEVATPLALVVAVLVPPAKVPLAPVWAGAVKVTVTPLAGDPFDVTVATSGLVNAVSTVALCPPPLVAVIAMVGGGVVWLVDEPELQPVRKLMAKNIKAKMLA